MKTRIFYFLLILWVVPWPARAQPRLVKMLVSSPYIEDNLYQPIADVVAGTIIREFKRAGGIEVLDREESERIIREDGGDGWVATRNQAAFIGQKMNADIVIYSSIRRNYNQFNYNIGFYQVSNNIIQRVLTGTFNTSDSPSIIGRVIRAEIEKLQRYVPLPSELVDPGSNLRMTLVDPDNLPSSNEIENFPEIAQFGPLERVLSYYRVFPGEQEYYRLAQGAQVMRFSLREELDEELTTRNNVYYMYGDFAIRHSLQAYFIKNCSTQALNVLIANNIPVFYNDDLILGYFNLMPDGFCIFKTISNNYFDTTEMSYHDRIVVMFIVPQPGRSGGVPREYLEDSLALFEDEWGETPTLFEITEGLLDLSSNPQE
ncbi:hypothetical protein ACFL55_01510 [Candidatus Latescibacterota bacterium]